MFFYASPDRTGFGNDVDTLSGAARQSELEGFRAILTEDQYQTYVKNETAMPDWGQSRVNRIVETLQLSEPQTTQLNTLALDLHASFRNFSLLMEEDAARNIPVTRNIPVQLYNGYDQNLRQILTPEQYATYQQNPELGRRPGRGFGNFPTRR